MPENLNFSLNEEQRMVQQAVEDALQPWLSRRDELREMARTNTFNDEMWQTFADVGLLGCLIPEQYGGNDMGLLALTLGFQKIGAMGLSSNLLLITCMDAACLVKNASDALKEKHLPEIAAGKQRFCFAVTEADAGTNTFHMKTSARREGDKFIINGAKQFITGVDVADYMLLVARSTSLKDAENSKMGQYHGLTLFVVPTDAPGLTRQKMPMSFNEGLNQWQLFFDDVEVAADCVVGEADMGIMAMFNSLNPERILAGAIANGMAEYCIDAAAAHARERKVFGDTPIGSYQGIAHPLAESKITHEAAGLMMLKAAWASDQDWDSAKVGSLANMSKFLNADSAIKAVDICLEIHGGGGFTEELGFLDLWNGARLLKTAPISREMILNFVGEWDLGLPKSY